jgi:hypothetical protein
MNTYSINYKQDLNLNQYYRKSKTKDGYDHRDLSNMYKKESNIRELFNKKKILDMLESNKISLNDKQIIAKDYLEYDKIKPLNIIKGIKHEFE